MQKISFKFDGALGEQNGILRIGSITDFERVIRDLRWNLDLKVQGIQNNNTKWFKIKQYLRRIPERNKWLKWLFNLTEFRILEEIIFLTHIRA